MTEPLITAADMAEFRALAESLMVDTCIVRRKTGETIDEDGVVIPVHDVVYPNPSWPDDHPFKNGKCKVQSTETVDSTPEAGGHTFTIQRLRVDVPAARAVGDYKPQVGDVPTIMTAAHDPHLASMEFRVTGLLHKTMATAYRLAVTNEPA